MVGFAPHELATNAAKHGALSADRGTVTISWQVGGKDGGAEPWKGLVRTAISCC